MICPPLQAAVTSWGNFGRSSAENRHWRMRLGLRDTSRAWFHSTPHASNLHRASNVGKIPSNLVCYLARVSRRFGLMNYSSDLPRSPL